MFTEILWVSEFSVKNFAIHLSWALQLEYNSYNRLRTNSNIMLFCGEPGEQISHVLLPVLGQINLISLSKNVFELKRIAVSRVLIKTEK